MTEKALTTTTPPELVRIDTLPLDQHPVAVSFCHQPLYERFRPAY